MLGTITPLGERARRQHWPLTVAAYVLGTSLAGVVGGILLAWAGRMLTMGAGADTTRLAAIASLLVMGTLVDRGLLPVQLPSPRRQVNDLWLGWYRGWVYGFGFGIQLGLGVVTVVVTSTVYVAYTTAFLSQSLVVGSLIGATFGFVRGVTLLPAAAVTNPNRLAHADSLLERWHERVYAVGALGRLGIAAVIFACVLVSTAA